MPNRRIPDDEVETIAELAERDRSFAVQLGARRLRDVATRYMGLHPGWTTGGKYDPRAYDRANAILEVAQGLDRATRIRRRLR
jgi:hypothetical protein